MIVIYRGTQFDLKNEESAQRFLGITDKEGIHPPKRAALSASQEACLRWEMIGYFQIADYRKARSKAWKTKVIAVAAGLLWIAIAIALALMG